MGSWRQGGGGGANWNESSHGTSYLEVQPNPVIGWHGDDRAASERGRRRWKKNAIATVVAEVVANLRERERCKRESERSGEREERKEIDLS